MAVPLQAPESMLTAKFNDQAGTMNRCPCRAAGCCQQSCRGWDMYALCEASRLPIRASPMLSCAVADSEHCAPQMGRTCGTTCRGHRDSRYRKADAAAGTR